MLMKNEDYAFHRDVSALLLLAFRNAVITLKCLTWCIKVRYYKFYRLQP